MQFVNTSGVVVSRNDSMVDPRRAPIDDRTEEAEAEIEELVLGRQDTGVQEELERLVVSLNH